MAQTAPNRELPGAFSRAAGRVFSTSVFLVLVGFASSVLYSRCLGAAGRGLYQSLIAYAMFFATFAQWGIPQAAAVLAGRGTFARARLTGVLFSFWGICALAAMALCALGFWLNPVEGAQGADYLLTLAGLPFIVFNGFAVAFFLGGQNLRQFDRQRALPALWVLVCGAVFLAGLGMGVRAALVFYGSGFALAGVLALRIMRACGAAPRFVWDGAVARALWRLGFAFGVYGVLGALNYRFALFYLQERAPLAQIGCFTLAMTLVETLWVLPKALGFVVLSRSAARENPADSLREAGRLLCWNAAVVGAAGLLLAFFGRGLIVWVFGADFEASADYLQILMPGAAAGAVSILLISLLSGMGRPWQMALALLPGLPAIVGLCVWWVPLWGAAGAAAAASAASICVAFGQMAVYLKLQREAAKAPPAC